MWAMCIMRGDMAGGGGAWRSDTGAAVCDWRLAMLGFSSTCNANERSVTNAWRDAGPQRYS
jgi:hypothetical protein